MSGNNDEKYALEQNELYEQQINKIVAKISLCIAGLCVLCQFLYVFIDYAPNVATINKTVLLPISALIIIVYFICRHYEFKGEWVKYLLVGGIVLMTSGLYMLYSFYCSYFILMPLIIATRYFDRRFVRNIAAATFIFFMTVCIINMTIGKEWYILRFNHEASKLLVFANPDDVLVFIIIPLGLTLIFATIYSVSSTVNGRKMLDRQVQDARRIIAVDTELKMAASIQKSALPEGSFITPDENFKVEACEVTAKEVGGDFYDYYMLDDNTMVFLAADVSDKGVPAAMFMMSAKKALRSAIECSGSLKDAIALANKLICDDNDDNMFLTMWLGMVNTKTGTGKYINAGHPYPIIKAADGKTRLIENKPDLFMGCLEEFVPEVHVFHMDEGDTLILYTDGITDAMNGAGESFGDERLKSTVEECRPDAKECTDGIMNKAMEFAAGQDQFDDMTVLSLQYLKQEPFVVKTFETSAGGEGVEMITEGVNSLLKEAGCPDEVRQNAGVVIDEICANISMYAYEGGQGRMDVRAYVGDNILRMVFEDDGSEFNPLEHDDPDVENSIMFGGLGIFFVKNLTDTMEYSRIDDSNVLTVEMIWGV